VVESLHNKHEALSSNSSTTKQVSMEGTNKKERETVSYWKYFL
jgi:endo-beta-N-acetylglucosaminidase D